MPTELLSVGSTHTLTQNVVYALPSVALWIHSSAALEVSLDNSNWAALASSTTGIQVTAPFVRSTTGSAIVMIKRY